MSDTATKDPVQAAKAAHLRYVHDDQPGIRREKINDKEFRYLGVNGQPITDEPTLARIRSLAIPPAYESVWICPLDNGHLQATGRDARGRKQYRYHSRWQAVRDETKYDRMLHFGEALPRIRERLDHDLARPGLPREKVLATIVKLLETTLIRVGNEEYARENKHYGLTTLRNRHVAVEGEKIHFAFQGKSGVKHAIDVKDRRLARIVQKVRDLPGQELFHYVDENTGEPRSVGSSDVNAYLHEISGEEFTAKDFRTWAGTVLCALTLRAFAGFESATAAKKNIVEAVKTVSERLGNTPSVCRKCYVHPAVLDAYLEGAVIAALNNGDGAINAERIAHALDSDETAVLAFLRERHFAATKTPALRKAA